MQGKKKDHSNGKLNQRRKKLRLKYIRLKYKINEVNKLHDHRFCNLGIIIAFFLA